MELDDFNKYYDTTISRYIKSIKQRDVNNCIKPISKKAKKKIYSFYQIKRDELRAIYLEKPVKALDRHKVASCMMYAILRAKVLKINKFIPNLPDYILMANEHLAFTVALNIVELYHINDHKNEEKYEYTIILPKTYHEKNDMNVDNAEYCTFMCNMCKYLYYIKNRKNFDIFAYATILFQLEKYTDTIMEMDKLLEKR